MLPILNYTEKAHQTWDDDIRLVEQFSNSVRELLAFDNLFYLVDILSYLNYFQTHLPIVYKKGFHKNSNLPIVI